MSAGGQQASAPVEESGFGPEATALLDRAAEYEHALHEGAVEFPEAKPGYFWSIQVVDCHKAFGPTKILRGVDLSIPEGMITVILGPSGTGKSVMIKHLIGLMFPDEGDVIVHGESLRDMTMRRLLEVRKKFGILFQDGALFGSMSVFNNVAFPLRQHTDLSEEEIHAIVNERLAGVGLTAAADRLPSELSGGMKKRAGFARALVSSPTSSSPTTSPRCARSASTSPYCGRGASCRPGAGTTCSPLPTRSSASSSRVRRTARSEWNDRQA